MRGADLLVQTLANAGVKTIFTLSGNQIMPVFDACIDAGIRLIHTRHEGAAVYMAEGYAQLTGELGVALVTAAPGFGNALGPLYMARQAENAVLLLSGDSPVAQDSLGAFQELDQVAVASGLTKFSARPMSADKLGTDTARAIRAARSGRAGPAHLALPFDVLNAQVSNPDVPSADEMAPSDPPPLQAELQALGQALAKAQRPVVLTGPSLNRIRAGELLDALAQAIDAPVIAMESPRGLNDPSLGSFGKPLASADLIVSLGKSIDFTTGFGKAIGQPDAPVIVVDPESAQLQRATAALGQRLVQSIQANPRAVARQLINQPVATGRQQWRAEMAQAIDQRAPEPVDKPAGPMRPAQLCAAVQAFVNQADNTILVIDGGEFGQWAQSRVSAPKRMINGPSGAIGGGLCYAIAASIAAPDATVLVMMGDGTAGFHFAEFETAARYNANLIAIIGHDAKWNAEYQIQLREYGPERLIECELSEARYDQAAAGLGCHGDFVTDPDKLLQTLRTAAASNKPACISVAIEGLPAPAGAGH